MSAPGAPPLTVRLNVQIHPEERSFELTLGALAVLALGLFLRDPTVVGWGGSAIVGLALARSTTLLSVARIRHAGFEMLWQTPEPRRRLARGEVLLVRAEVRNRDDRAVRFVRLRAVASPSLEVTVEPTSGEVAANGRLVVDVRVEPHRVGRHAIHGLSLELRGGPGLFEVPLTFANPFGIDVFPRAYLSLARSPRGGRSRSAAELGSPGPHSGNSTELRELREHQPGDSLRRVAWKASARRGRLLVRDYQREEREVVWLVLDASVEHWAGPWGRAPLDWAIDEISSELKRHIARGNSVGLVVVGGRVLSRLEPGRGAAHALRALDALAHETATLDEDRSGFDTADAAARVLEHLRQLDAVACAGLHRDDVEAIAHLASRWLERAPLQPGPVQAQSSTGRALREYLSAFGVGSPARLEPDRPKTDLVLAEVLRQLAHHRKERWNVSLWATPPAPGTRPQLQEALKSLPRRRISLDWHPLCHDKSLPRAGSPTLPAAATAVSLRALLSERAGSAWLRRHGIRVHARPQSQHR